MADIQHTPELSSEIPSLETSTRYALDALKKGMEKLTPNEKPDADALLSKFEKFSASKLDAKETFNNMKVGMTAEEKKKMGELMAKMGVGSDVMKAFNGTNTGVDPEKSAATKPSDTSVTDDIKIAAKKAEKAIEGGDVSK